MCAVNNGVLVGNWSGDYSNGTAPYVWTSSVPILQQHYITRVPVCFGQCWVFSGILTTGRLQLGQSHSALMDANDPAYACFSTQGSGHPSSQCDQL